MSYLHSLIRARLEEHGYPRTQVRIWSDLDMTEYKPHLKLKLLSGELAGTWDLADSDRALLRTVNLLQGKKGLLPTKLGGVDFPDPYHHAEPVVTKSTQAPLPDKMERHEVDGAVASYVSALLSRAYDACMEGMTRRRHRKVRLASESPFGDKDAIQRICRVIFQEMDS